mmetsp:Transcript_3409/g.8853  ORF Transcript_3409/g.8853 Transcript_3409/m.8853 type:complete len:446 (-) Transcript_3409:440-1777(-)
MMTGAQPSPKSCRAPSKGALLAATLVAFNGGMNDHASLAEAAAFCSPLLAGTSPRHFAPFVGSRAPLALAGASSSTAAEELGSSSDMSSLAAEGESIYLAGQKQQGKEEKVEGDREETPSANKWSTLISDAVASASVRDLSSLASEGNSFQITYKQQQQQQVEKKKGEETVSKESWSTLAADAVTMSSTDLSSMASEGNAFQLTDQKQPDQEEEGGETPPTNPRSTLVADAVASASDLSSMAAEENAFRYAAEEQQEKAEGAKTSSTNVLVPDPMTTTSLDLSTLAAEGNSFRYAVQEQQQQQLEVDGDKGIPSTKAPSTLVADAVSASSTDMSTLASEGKSFQVAGDKKQQEVKEDEETSQMKASSTLAADAVAASSKVDLSSLASEGKSIQKADQVQQQQQQELHKSPSGLVTYAADYSADLSSLAAEGKSFHKAYEKQQEES